MTPSLWILLFYTMALSAIKFYENWQTRAENRARKPETTTGRFSMFFQCCFNVFSMFPKEKGQEVKVGHGNVETFCRENNICLGFSLDKRAGPQLPLHSGNCCFHLFRDAGFIIVISKPKNAGKCNPSADEQLLASDQSRWFILGPKWSHSTRVVIMSITNALSWIHLLFRYVDCWLMWAKVVFMQIMAHLTLHEHYRIYMLHPKLYQQSYRLHFQNYRNLVHY